MRFVAQGSPLARNTPNSIPAFSTDVIDHLDNLTQFVTRASKIYTANSSTTRNVAGATESLITRTPGLSASTLRDNLNFFNRLDQGDFHTGLALTPRSIRPELSTLESVTESYAACLMSCKPALPNDKADDGLGPKKRRRSYDQSGRVRNGTSRISVENLVS